MFNRSWRLSGCILAGAIIAIFLGGCEKPVAEVDRSKLPPPPAPPKLGSTPPPEPAAAGKEYKKE